LEIAAVLIITCTVKGSPGFTVLTLGDNARPASGHLATWQIGMGVPLGGAAAAGSSMLADMLADEPGSRARTNGTP